MKNVILTACFVFMIMSFCACSNTDENSYTDDNTQNTSKISEVSNNESSKKSDIKTLSSSVSSPLVVNAWGTASKYSTKEQNYVNVPIRITSVTRGKQANETVKKFMNESSSYNYTEPDKNAEWVVADYEISLDGFPVDIGGTDNSITSFITGNDGDYINYGDKKWCTTTINITDGKYYYEGIVKGKIAYQMINNRTDYIITLGEYNETQSFFSENSKENS